MSETRRCSYRIGIVDRIACSVGIWALRRLFGECETDVRKEWPDDPDVQCIGCDATRLIRSMEDLRYGG